MFVLIHSPLGGPYTWVPVAEVLRQKGVGVIVPTLTSSQESATPYWQQHAAAVAQALQAQGGDPSQQPLILVGHSGAGMLLPAIRQVTGRPVAAYLFVDAGLPVAGKSRLDLFEDAEAAAAFRQAATGGLLPAWTEEDLREVIPSIEQRRRFVAELRPLPLAVYEDPLPVFAGWPDAPCGYLRFGANPAYDTGAARALREGWAYSQLEGMHFHMLVDPPAVAQALLTLVERMGLPVAPG
ncbi:MAG: alpha/beta hydrolase [Chloroflexi bacterium]|nr:alpha/beta hydrolase [Chloroflexota bacterium]